MVLLGKDRGGLTVGVDAFAFEAPNSLREYVFKGAECSIAFSQAPSSAFVTRDWIVIIYEWNQEHRTIPLDGRPHAPAAIRSYAGDSLGRWEGDTLVIETTNWKGSPNARRNFAGAEEGMTLIERLTRISENDIEYTFTVNDPKTYTAPFKVAFPITQEPGYQNFEYACHEGNYAMGDILSGARAEAAENADPWRGLKMGVATYTLRDLPIEQAIAGVKRVGLKYVSIKNVKNHIDL